MKIVPVFFICCFFISCNFEFVKDEEPKENPPKPYVVNIDWIFISRNSFEGPECYLYDKSMLPTIETVYSTDNVPVEAFSFDSLVYYKFSLFQLPEKQFFEFGINRDELNSDNKFYAGVIRPINDVFYYYTKENLKIKFGFFHKFYSDSITIPVPHFLFDINTHSTLLDSTLYFDSRTDSSYFYDYVFEISVNKTNFNKLMNDKWTLDTPKISSLDKNYNSASVIVTNNYTIREEGETVTINCQVISYGKKLYLDFLLFENLLDNSAGKIRYYCFNN